MSAPNETAERVYVSADAAETFTRQLLDAHGLPPADLATVARCLVHADLRGVDTHGIARLPGYLDRVRRGLINARPSLEPVRVAAAAAHLDGQDGFGFVVGTRAIAEAIDMAREAGIGIVAARRSTHFGMAASYVLPAVEAGMIAMVFSNASPAMPPWGGKDALLGTNPFAAGVPGGARGPFVLDMSPAVAARGKIRRAERRGESIPLGYALDGEGRPTTDPTAALGGVVLPMGGHKGSGLSMLMDIMGGVLSGAAFGGEVADQYKVYDRPQDVGHVFLAMRPDLFISAEAFRDRMDRLVERVRAVPLADGFSEIMIAGEPESRLERLHRRTGIPYSPADLAPLQAEAAAAGIAPLAAAAAPLG